MVDLRERLRALEARCTGQTRELRALEKIERLHKRIRALERERAALEAQVGDLHAVLSLSRSLSRIGPTADLPQAVLAAQATRPRGFQMADLDRAQALAEPLTLAWRVPARAEVERALAPRGVLEEALHREAARGRRYRRPFVILRLDLEPGSTREEWPRLTSILRREIRRADLLAHLGGASFALLLPETEPAAADAVARKLRAAVTAAGPGGLCVGYACCPAAASEGAALLELAEEALLQAKAQGGCCVCGTPAAEELPAPGV